MKIAIAGAGMAGTYLYRILKEQGFEAIDLYDQKKSNACGHRPCGWGFAPPDEYNRLLSRFIDPKAHVLGHHRRMVVDGLEISSDMLTVNKPAMNRALLDGAPVLYGPLDPERYDRVIDATGVERAYLGPTEGRELMAELVQYRVRTSKDLGLWINTSAIGYEWCFPLDKDEYHLGFGNMRPGASEHDLMHYLDGSQDAVKCSCQSRIRFTSPYHSRPFVNGKNIVGVGESIGTVGPLGGDGNLYAMQCAELLAEHWDDLDAYTGAVLKRYDWMRKERLALERLMGGDMPTASDLRTFIQHTRRVGLGMGPINALRFFRTALQSDRRTTKAEQGMIEQVAR